MATSKTGFQELGPGDLLPRLKDQGYDAERVLRRRRWVETKTATSLDHIGRYSFDSELMRGNIENPIGVAQIPMGVAGPILVHGRHAKGLFYIPMATTEGALIRSYERGMVAITKSGGAQVSLQNDENQIVPTFFFPDVHSAQEFTEWLPQQIENIRSAAEATTRHGRLTTVHCYQMGRQVLVNFGLTTGDAQGMNMLVKAIDAACKWIQQNYPISSYFVFSGMCSEKRPSGFLLTRGKGKRVTAGCLLTHDVLRLYLHCTARQLFDVWHSTILGHVHANAIGYNAHCANGLTAIFIATGQDVANVVNGSCAITYFELQEEGLFVSITLPALEVATVGGGTALPTPREALSMLDCHGAGKARKFAEVVAAALLGGEISMGAAITTGEFVAAHEHYGRNRPK